MNFSFANKSFLAQSKNIFFALFQEDISSVQSSCLSFLSQNQAESFKKFFIREFSGKNGEVKVFWDGSKKLERLVFFGLGEKKSWNFRKNRILPRLMIKFAKANKISEFSFDLDYFTKLTNLNLNEAASLFSTESIAADFVFDIYKSRPQKTISEISKITLVSSLPEKKKVFRALQEGVILGEEINNCRMLANTPGGDMTPSLLAKYALAAGKRWRFSVRVLGIKEIRALKMGGILGVSRGSQEEPKFIILEYKGSRSAPLVAVGKGITFDSGGLNLKPTRSIYEMHMDMSGGGAVICGISAVARLKLPVHLIGLIPAAENMPSGGSYRPGDILKTMFGKTIEVLNTDAEGRIIMADALNYSLQYKPKMIVDFATLTGSAQVALGNFCSALFTNRSGLVKELVSVGEKSGDYVWPMPIWDEYLQEIKSVFADIANASVKNTYGDAIHAAKFLEIFVGKYPWAHIDIAPRMTSVEADSLSAGALGTGVRYLVELANIFKNIKTNDYGKINKN